MPTKSYICTNHKPQVSTIAIRTPALSEAEGTRYASRFTNYAKQSQFPGCQMNPTAAIIRCYENMRFEKQSQNKAKTNPIQSQFKAKTNPIHELRTTNRDCRVLLRNDILFVGCS